MDALWDNRILIAVFMAWLTAQTTKTVIYSILYRHFEKERLFGSGGMPSSHTAMVVCLAVSVGMREGIATSLFAVCAVLAMVVIYDAMGVRRETGRQGEVINRILREFILEGKPISEDKMKTLVGHTPLEVCGGIIVGVLVALIFMLI